MIENNKIKRLSFKDQILQILVQKILTGVLKPGDRIKELEVATEMGTSQAPVREAILALKAMGYVDHKPHTGARVKEFSLQEMVEAYKVREALELFALERHITSLTKKAKKFKEHQIGLEKAVQANDIKTYSDHDNKFHRLIISASGNVTMMNVWDSLQIQTRVEKVLRGFSIPLDEMLKFHAPIVTAIISCDQKAATKILREHYRFTHNYLNQSL